MMKGDGTHNNSKIVPMEADGTHNNSKIVPMEADGIHNSSIAPLEVERTEADGKGGEHGTEGILATFTCQ